MQPIENQLHIDSTLAELNLMDATLDIREDLKLVYPFFEKNVPGICLLNNRDYFGLLSRSRFFEIMSKQFMYDLYSKRNIEFFFDGNKNDNQLVLEADTRIVDALNLAITRSGNDVYEPIIVSFSSSEYKVLDFYELILAQSKILGVVNSLLKEANNFKTEVMAIVAHDLRNPIGAIKGFSKLIEDLPENSNSYTSYAEIIYKTADHMENMVQNFLASVKNESTEMELIISQFDMGVLIEEVISNLKHLADAKNQTILFSCTGENFLTKSDRLKVGEVIENLVSNALKYSNNFTDVQISLSQEQNFLEVKITDQGPGFSESDKMKIFGKFQQLSAKPIGKGTSTGIGLFTVKKIIDKINGEIMLESIPGKGSTFAIRIPA
jgi:signal transduction histidine kinase